jgi:alanyl-tRNA synthetase
LLRRPQVEGLPAKDLRGLADAMQRQIGSGVAAVVSVFDGKAAVVVSVSEDLKDSVDAVALLRGRPDFAKGGGPDGTRAEAALAAIERGLASRPAAAE